MEYILEKSSADLALVHHDDLSTLLGAMTSTGVKDALCQLTPIIFVKNGVGMLESTFKAFQNIKPANANTSMSPPVIFPEQAPLPGAHHLGDLDLAGSIMPRDYLPLEDGRWPHLFPSISDQDKGLGRAPVNTIYDDRSLLESILNPRFPPYSRVRYNQGMVPQRASDHPSVALSPTRTHDRHAPQSENLDPSRAPSEESAARERFVMYNRDMVPQQASDLPSVPNGSRRSDSQHPFLRINLHECFTPESAAVQPPLNAFYGDDVVMYDRDTVPQRASDLPSVPPRPARAPGADPARRFACKLCDERFDRQSGLDTHMRSRSHEDRRPYACSQPGCSKTFSVKSNLRRHERTHMADSTFELAEERPSHSGHYSSMSKPPELPSTYFASSQPVRSGQDYADAGKPAILRDHKTHNADRAFEPAEERPSYSVHHSSTSDPPKLEPSAYYASSLRVRSGQNYTDAGKPAMAVRAVESNLRRHKKTHDADTLEA
ncbi:hypothetical protein JB92DRAFT_2855708 [Gautieria morchelliformis]|nr:hypothetical protein JB92DRAFT_2855708 [Gautieria morchelliformis]